MTLVADGAYFVVCSADGLLAVVSGLAVVCVSCSCSHVLVVCFMEKMILFGVRMCS